MSKPNLDSDGFQIIKSKRSAKNKQTKLPPKETLFQKQEVLINIEASYQRILFAVDDLKGSQYLEDVIKAVSSELQNRNVREIVCFGLGHIGECNISRYQLALLLCLKNNFKPRVVLVHDPLFYIGECEILKRFDIDIIEENNEGSYIIRDQDTTVVYLPHCPKQLTNNFLWSNWGVQLENCILLCNSFTSLIENQPNRFLSETVPYIYKIFPYISETTLSNSFHYKDIFNDTSLHVFPIEKIKLLDSNFWMKKDKPKYEETEEFITSLMVDKLKL